MAVTKVTLGRNLICVGALLLVMACQAPTTAVPAKSLDQAEATPPYWYSIIKLLGAIEEHYLQPIDICTLFDTSMQQVTAQDHLPGLQPLDCTQAQSTLERQWVLQYALWDYAEQHPEFTQAPYEMRLVTATMAQLDDRSQWLDINRLAKPGVNFNQLAGIGVELSEGGAFPKVMRVLPAFVADRETFNMEREIIQYEGYVLSWLPDEVLWLQLTSIRIAVGEQLARKLKPMLAQRKPKQVVLDLRGNTGGVLEAFPVTVLVDEGSAAAAEIIAAALAENDRAQLVGTTTAGHYTLQIVEPIETYAVKITTAEFFSPLGKDFRQGVAPHVCMTHWQGKLCERKILQSFSIKELIHLPARESALAL